MCVVYSVSSKIIQSVLKLIGHNRDARLEQFIKYFYNFIYNSDLKVSDKFLLHIAQDAYNFVLYKDNDSKLSVCNVSNMPGIEGDFTILKVVNNNIPFLVDSIIASIKSQNLTICYYSNSIINVRRKSGLIDEISTLEDENNCIKESVIYIIVKGVDDSFIDILRESSQHVLEAVNLIVKDWQLMLKKLDEMASMRNQTKHFLHWLKNNNFVFLGYQECVVNEKGELLPNNIQNLGLLKMDQNVVVLSEELSSVYVVRSNVLSIVHRRIYMDCIGIKEYDKHRKLVKERRFFGLFTSVAESQDIRTIPIIKDKVAAIEKRAGFVIGGHNNKALISILQAFSRDELFQSSVDELLQICTSIMSLMIRPRVKLLLRNFGNVVNCIVLIPMRYMSAKLMVRICDILKAETSAEDSVVYSRNMINEYDLIKLHIVLKFSSMNHFNRLECELMEKKLRNVTERWEDRFIDNLYNTFSTVEDIFIRYCNAFPIGYRETFEPNEAYYDIKKLEIVRRNSISEVDLKLINNKLHYQLKVYTPNKGGLELAQILEITKNFGATILSHNGYYVGIDDGIWIHSFLLSQVDGLVNNNTLKEQFEVTLIKVFAMEINNDYFNSLIILAGLKWKEVLLIRVLSAYLKQISFSYNQEYIQRVVSEYPKIMKYLIQLFRARFNPNIDIDRVKTTNILKEKIRDFLKEVNNISHDYILCSIFNLIMAIVRTNYYQGDKPYLSIKFDSSKISNLPKPCPYRELYVYSSCFEGIHLRGGKLARGGLRWSDRTEDFRTEVLGLMRAQMTKNTVIVPVGAKGGFVIKDLYIDVKENGVECYKNFIRGMLDITDNIVDGRVVSPKNVIRYDEDDPYLVVAADKGTASFSDYANQVAAEYNFWLGDAFASGGSAGYDHKKIGITARGAWIAAQRHFWKMNRDIDKEDLNVIGIGDMSGDLFGNGMLLSRKICLLGAFNHIHIFVDPNPDPEKSFMERKRLFELPFSSWADYNRALISQGGGVFARSNKSIDISPEVKRCFNIKENKLSPNDLIKYLLKAKVDFIWNGGIGTFVKSTNESHSIVGDKTNDALRVNGKDVRAAMFIEGGNLGCTQLGRIEYADKGGYINTDFIDNSGGVACSDLEVNIKIALVSAVKENNLSLVKRNEILSSMIDEVASKVLNDHNKIETKALLLENMQAKERVEQHHRLLITLEKSGLLKRSIEFLPSDKDIAKISKGFSSPQLAILISYARADIKNGIINSNLPEKDFFAHSYLLNYFPQNMLSISIDYILRHQLRREIISTCIANEVVNRMGCVFINNLVADTGIKTYDAAYIYIIVSRLYDLDYLWREIDKLDGAIGVDAYLKVVRNVQKFIGRVSFWLVRNASKFNFTELTEVVKFHDIITTLSDNLDAIVDERLWKVYCQELDQLLKICISEELAKRIANLYILAYALDIIFISEKTALPILDVGYVYFELKSMLKFELINKVALQMKKASSSYWNRSAISSALDDLSEYYCDLTINVIRSCSTISSKLLVKAWAKNSKKYIECYNSFLTEIITTKLDLSRLISIIRRVRSLLYIENV